MARILILTEENGNKEIAQALARAGFELTFVPREEADSEITRNPPDLVLIDTGRKGLTPSLAGLVREIAEGASLPVIAIVPREDIANLAPDVPASDFLFSPYDPRELIIRVRRLVREAGPVEEGGIIRLGPLAIDTNKAEVMVDGRRIELTFREYELLRFFAGNPGRVFTREALLNKVWGYDYYGGDRTVDVHIRRLRSKIETDKLTFIETVRNIGYRFRDDLGK